MNAKPARKAPWRVYALLTLTGPLLAVDGGGLHQAAAKGDLEEVKSQLKRDADVNGRTLRTRQTALHLAAKNGHLDVVKHLLREGALVNARDEGGSTPLHQAAYRGHTQVMEALLARGADSAEKR